MPGASPTSARKNPAGFKVRLRAAKAAAGLRLDVSIGVATFPEAIDLGDADQVRLFADFLETQPTDGQPTKLIAFDTYAASTPGANENSAEDTTAAMVNALYLRDRFKATVLLAHHTNATGTRERGQRDAWGRRLHVLDEPARRPHPPGVQQAPQRLALRPYRPAAHGGPGRPARHGDPAGDRCDGAGRSSDGQRAQGPGRPAGQLQTRRGDPREWATACVGMSQATLYRVADKLTDKGLVQTVGSRYRLTAKATDLS